MAWAQSVPRGATIDLTASGIADTTISHSDPEGFDGSLEVEKLGSRVTAGEALTGFVEQVAERYDCDPELIVQTTAASGAIMQTLVALVRAGDHVVVERPTYEPLHRVPEILGATVSRLERKFEDGWKVLPDRLAQLLTPRTRAVLLTNLHNPSGVAIDAATLSEVSDLAARVGALVLVDEVYLDYDFSCDPDARVRPACVVAKNGVSWSSTTKAFGFSALRLGWVVCGDIDAARAIRSAGDYLHVYPPVASTLLGRQVLRRAKPLTDHAAARAAAGRAIVDRWIEEQQRFSWVPPDFGITGLLKLPAMVSDIQFSDHLRQRYETQVVPGSMFETPGYVRLSFGGDSTVLEEGLANLSAAIEDLI